MSERINVLVVGKGGREHTLCLALSNSGITNRLYWAPGNGGASGLIENVNRYNIETTEGIVELANWAEKSEIGLTVVGPEVPQSLGVVDIFKRYGLSIFGNSMSSSRLESSKIWAETFKEKYKIPTPRSAVFQYGELNKALKFNQDYFGVPPWQEFVIKADGLAKGKGVELPISKVEARKIIKEMMEGGKYGDAGRGIVIQEKLKGRELSAIAITDGTNFAMLPPTRDYKLFNGKNSGGMGAVSGRGLVSNELWDTIQTEIIKKTIDGMRNDGHPLSGVLYAGLMITEEGKPYVLEYNTRFGDPETQAQIVLLSPRCDFGEILLDCVNKRLNPQKLKFEEGVGLCVVLASKNYPDTPQIGDEITGQLIPTDPEVRLIHAGTKWEDGKLITSGGRVLGIATHAKDIKTARSKVYSTLDQIYFEGMQYRVDIGLNATPKC